MVLQEDFIYILSIAWIFFSHYAALSRPCAVKPTSADAFNLVLRDLQLVVPFIDDVWSVSFDRFLEHDCFDASFVAVASRPRVGQRLVASILRFLEDIFFVITLIV